MPYTNLPIGTENPGLILLLIDQSGSMSQPFAGSTKMEYAMIAINNCIYEILFAAQAGEKVKDRCQIGVIGYGNNQAEVLLGAWVSELPNKRRGERQVTMKLKNTTGQVENRTFPLDIWVEGKSLGDTPMHLAFDKAATLIQERWLPGYPGSFPPIVINVTDGRPTFNGKESHDEAIAAAKRLTNLRTTDGNILLLNAHISADNSNEILLPAKMPRGADEFMKFLFEISSPLPETMLHLAGAAGFETQPGARGCIYNAGAEGLTKLILFGSNPARCR